MKSPYGSWSDGTFTNNQGVVYQDAPVVGDAGGWSRAVAADSASLGDLFKSLFSSFGKQQPNAPTAPQTGTPPSVRRSGNLPVFVRPNVGVPGMPNTTFAAATGVNGEPLASFGPGSVPMMARPNTPQPSMPLDGIALTLDTLKKRAPAKGFIIG